MASSVEAGLWRRLLQRHLAAIVEAVYDDSLLLGCTFSAEIISYREYMELRARREQGPAAVVQQLVGCIVGKDEGDCGAFWDVLEGRVMDTCTRLKAVVLQARTEYEREKSRGPLSSGGPPSAVGPPNDGGPSIPAAPQRQTEQPSSQERELSWRRSLLAILEELTEEETQRLRFYLKEFNVPEGPLESARGPPQVARLLVSTLGLAGSVEAVRRLLPLLPRNDEHLLRLLEPHLVIYSSSSSSSPSSPR